MEGEGRFKEGLYVYIWLIHIVVWQKPTQCCEAIIIQLKLNFNKELNIINKFTYHHLVAQQ